MSSDHLPVEHYRVRVGKYGAVWCEQDHVENVNDSCVIIKVGITVVDQCTTIDGRLNSERLRFSFLRKSNVAQHIPHLGFVLQSYPIEVSFLIQQYISWICEEAANAIEGLNPREFVIVIPIEVTRTVICDEQDDRLLQSLLELMEEASGNKLVPAAPSSVEALKSKKFDKKDSRREPCAVCLDEYLIGVDVTVMPCSHMYHKHCIEPWLKKTNTCPLCRLEMPT
ncbi:hypothetical protein IFM89_021922 [Coptis chinensis]|uniref:RING-type E3 ubiquitin transferase n=1 Tax=Coptis chinensis TaxID=261450 RepID=A0A835HGB2_9MAGN|nr:hypothetical protein IFM89_021922 [Coptis chinensis]